MPSPPPPSPPPPPLLVLLRPFTASSGGSPGGCEEEEEEKPRRRGPVADRRTVRGARITAGGGSARPSVNKTREDGERGTRIMGVIFAPRERGRRSSPALRHSRRQERDNMCRLMKTRGGNENKSQDSCTRSRPTAFLPSLPARSTPSNQQTSHQSITLPSGRDPPQESRPTPPPRPASRAQEPRPTPSRPPCPHRPPRRSLQVSVLTIVDASIYIET